MEDFIDLKSIKTIMVFDEKTAELIFANNKETLFFLYKDNSEKTEHYRKVLEESSEILKGEILLSESLVTNGLGERLLEYLGLSNY